MRKLGLMAMVLALGMLLAGPAWADKAGRFALGLTAGGAWYDDEKIEIGDFTSASYAWGTDFDTAFTFGVDASYRFTDLVSLELGVEYANPDVTLELPDLGYLNGGSLTQIPVLLTLKVHPFSTKSFGGYAGLGLGYYFSDFDLSEEYRNKTNGGTVDAENSLGMHICAGAEYFFSDEISFLADFRLAWNAVDLKMQFPLWGENDQNTGLFSAKLGMKYYF